MWRGQEPIDILIELVIILKDQRYVVIVGVDLEELSHIAKSVFVLD